MCALVDVHMLVKFYMADCEEACVCVCVFQADCWSGSGIRQTFKKLIILMFRLTTLSLKRNLLRATVQGSQEQVVLKSSTYFTSDGV